MATIVFHSAGVTGWTDRRLPLRSSTMSPSAGVSRSTGQRHGVGNVCVSLMSTMNQRGSSGLASGS